MRYKIAPFFLASLLSSLPICGMDITLGSADIEAMNGLRAALDTINNAPDPTNTITIPFALLTNQQYNLPPIEITNGNQLTINGQTGGTTLNGLQNFPTFGPFRGFFVSSGNVTVENMNLVNSQAIGGSGGSGGAKLPATQIVGSGGGGGMGAGGAFFVKSGTTLTLNLVSMEAALAQGGNGGDVASTVSGGGGGGGGGMGGNGGSHLIDAVTVSGGGGGGLFGAGADCALISGVGGGGLFGNGGTGTTDMTNGAGGGGGGRVIPPGGNGENAPSAVIGGNGSGPNGGIGGGNTKNMMTNTSENGLDGGADTGGGGGGIVAMQSGTGGSGGDNGGGGGGASIDGGNVASGGNGGMYGGGGSAGAFSGGFPLATSGAGNFGGGGAGASAHSVQRPGGIGGFGGGAGGCSNYTGGTSGLEGSMGGFGGGGSGAVAGGSVAPVNPGGESVAFGGQGGDVTDTENGSGGGGGGGAGLGGAIFIHDGGTVIMQDGTAFSNTNTVVAGQGGAGFLAGAGNAGQALGADLFMMSGSQLTFDINDSLTIASDIVGNNGVGGGNVLVNGVTKTGVGLVSLNGTNTYTGTTTVAQGTLFINGMNGVSTNSTIVNNGGTLRGTGTIFGSTTVQSGGIVSPGNSIGTLHFTGPVTLDAGAQVTIEANDTGASSLLEITGTATLGGTLLMSFDPGTYSQGQLFEILTATGGVSGEFSTVKANLVNLMLQAIYNPNSVQVVIGSVTPVLVLTGIGGNAKIVGDYLNSINTEPFLLAELIALAGLSPAQLDAALKSISPGSKSFATYVSQSTMFTVNKVATTRMSIQRSQAVMGRQNLQMAALFQESQSQGLFAANTEDTLPKGSTTKASAGKDDYAVWASGLGDFMHQNSEKQNPSFGATSGGGLVGFETYRFSSVLLGASAGYAHSNINVHQNGGESDIDYYTLGLYETTYIQNGYIELSLWGTYNHFKNERHIVYPGFDKTAHSTHHGWQVTPSISAGYDFGFTWGVIEPFASLDAVVNFESKFSETKASPFNMQYSHHISEFLRFEAGLNAYEMWQRDWGSCIVRETLSYVLRKPYGVGTVNAAIVGAPGSFTVYSFTEQENILSPGVEVFFKHKNGGFLSVTYDGEFGFGSGYMSNELIGKVGVYF